jgi:hypothetical protein
MGVNHTLQKELKVWVILDREKEESTYERDLRERIELLNWVIGNIKHSRCEVCDLIETRMNEFILKINESDSN